MPTIIVKGVIVIEPLDGSIEVRSNIIRVDPGYTLSIDPGVLDNMRLKITYDEEVKEVRKAPQYTGKRLLLI